MWKNIPFALASVLVVSCTQSDTTEEKKDTVSPISSSLILELSAEEIRNHLLQRGMPIGDLSVHGYKAYKISYLTQDERDQEVRVSGLLTIPTELDNHAKEKGIALLSYAHGTISLNDYAPSVFLEKYRYPMQEDMIFTSLGGFATLQADYIGYGDSQSHIHPYVMKKSLAQTSIDFIKAVKVFAKKENIKLNEKLFLTGYSEGGFTAMATLQEMEAQGLPVTAAAPMAGAYDLVYESDKAFDKDDTTLTGFSMTYFAMTLHAYSEAYDKNLSESIAAPYAQMIPTLLDGVHSFLQINKALPTDPEAFFRPEFLQAYAEEDHWLKKRLKENSVYDWTPKTAMHLLHCMGDDQVAYGIAQKTHERMLANGASEVKLITLDTKKENLDHGECVLPAYEHALQWFTELNAE